jgi:hypothetical protein
MDRQEEQIAHELEIIMPANPHKTAPHAKLHQFAIHTPGWRRGTQAINFARGSRWLAATIDKSIHRVRRACALRLHYH